MRQVICGGHKRGAVVSRTVGGDHEPRFFSIYSPMVIAGLQRQDPSIVSRSIHVELVRKSKTDRCEPLTVQTEAKAIADGASLGRQALRWMHDNAELLVEAASSATLMPAHLLNREGDNWVPLFAAARMAGGEWPAKIDAAQKALEPEPADRNAGDLRALLLVHTREIFNALPYGSNEKGFVTLDYVVDQLHQMVDAPWNEMPGTGRPISTTGVGNLLRPFKIAALQKKVSGRNLRVYTRAIFEPAWSRYLPDEANAGTREGESDGRTDSSQPPPAAKETATRS
jgi:hypothetical protein